MPELLGRKQAEEILGENNCSGNVIRHCEAVSREAKRIAERVRANGTPVDVEFVETAALLHDIGRSRTHGIRHGIEGASILKDHPGYARVCLRHLGGGIDRAEAKKLGLPEGDFLPETLEEKIVCYADKLIDDYKKVGIEETLEKFRKRLGGDHPTIERIKKLDKEIRGLMR